MRRRKGRAKGSGVSNEAAAAPVSSTEIPRAQIEGRAYELFLERGCRHGHDLEDWLAAERELTGSKTSATG